MPIKPADQQKLDALYAECKSSYQGRREDYFALMYLMRKFGVAHEEVAHQIAWGGNDYGLDAYYFDRSSKNLYLYQFKWTEDHGQFKTSMERLVNDGLPRIFGNPLQDASQNDLLTYLKKDLKEIRQAVEGVYIHFVFKGNPDAVENSEGLGKRREDLEAKAHLVWQFFGREVGYQVDFIADKPGTKGPPPKQVYSIRLDQAATVAHNGRLMHVGFVPLLDLYEIYRGLGQYFFDRNIRAALSPDNEPNRKLREAFDRIVLKELDEPAVFAFRHNGVTIAAERMELEEGKAVLHVPRLLNGAQTIASLARFLEQHAGNSALRHNRQRLADITVLAKIVVDDPSSDFVTQVTISNNQQNPVPPWALRAMDQRQVDFADKFRDEVGIYYSRQEGAFANLSDDDREEMGIESGKDIRIRPLAQTFLAVQGDVTNMRQMPEVFQSQKLYESTFKNSYLHVDARAIVLSYKIGLMLGRVATRVREQLPDKYYSAASASKHLAWALLIQALLHEKGSKKYSGWLEDYGIGLTKEPGFGDLLKQLTGSRVVPLVKSLCAMPSYNAKAESGRFDFLRNTEAFKRAMDLASDKFGWSKQSF
jgi:hypothetical protein